MLPKYKGYVFALLSAVSYGLIPLFIIPIKQIDFPLHTTLFYRFLIAACFLLAILLYRKESLKVNQKELGILMLLGLFYGFSSDFLFMGYDLLSPGIASTILFVYPIIVALILILFFNEKLKKGTALSLVLTLIGVYILSVKESVFDLNFVGLTITLLAALFYALYIITVNKSKIQISGWKMTFYSMLFTSLYYLVKALIWNDSLALESISFLWDFTLFAFVTTVISMTTLIYAVRLIGSTPTAILGAMEPVVAVMVSVVLFHELLTMNLIIGVALILIGVIISILSERKTQN